VARTRILRLLAAAVAVSGLAATTMGGQASVSVAPSGADQFTIYHPPDSSAGAHTAAEPSIGADWKTGALMYQADLVTYRVTFDSATPPAATWTDVSSSLTSQQTLDPILFTDRDTGRTFVSQLAGACSLSEFSDDDGASWTPDQGCGLPSGADHQSFGGGPFAPPLTGTVYPHAVYYCSQDVATAFCAMSADGSLTFGPGIPIYALTQCGGLHGHVKVAPDGTAIVPNQNCGPAPGTQGITGNFPNQAAVVSKNDGATWAVNVIPDSVSTLRSDPAVAADAAGTWYFGYEDGVDNASGEQVAGRAMVSISKDDGTTWSPSVDVGAALGLQNVTFPEMIAGDPGRAAFAFLGSTTAGDPENQTFQGFWYLYVALTYDGGTTWTVQNVTPGDPVERGCIYLAGSGDCPDPPKRNLLDFMDVTASKDGRVAVGYADGCTGTCVTQQASPCADPACGTGATASADRYTSIARMTCGKGLVAAQDSALSCSTGTTTSATPTPSPGTTTTAAAAGAATPNTGAASPAAGAASAAALLAAAGLGLGARLRRRRGR